MRVAYCSLLLPEEKRLAEKSKDRLSGISTHKVTKATILGIDKNIDQPIDVINTINTLNYPKFPQIIFHNEKWNHTNIKDHIDYHIGYVNIFGVKYVTQYYSLYKALKNWSKKLDEPGMICVHHVFLPAMFAAVKIAQKNSRIRLCLNTGDIPGHHGLKAQDNMSIKQFLTVHLVERNILKLAKKFDCFVFVTKEMADAFEVQEKPYTVVECTYIEPNYKNIPIIPKTNKKTIFYAGSLREEYGILHLLKAFSLITNSDYELVIAGGGSGEQFVKEYALKDSRIKFIGFISPEEVFAWQKISCALISPRKSDMDYVKYSFPSKSVDSLASGIPYIAHRLPCDPPEYSDFINYPVDESDEALKDKIIEICELSEYERSKIGERAKTFILREKCPKVMTKRIVDMWMNVLDTE